MRDQRDDTPRSIVERLRHLFWSRQALVLVTDEWAYMFCISWFVLGVLVMFNLVVAQVPPFTTAVLSMPGRVGTHSLINVGGQKLKLLCNFVFAT